MKMKIIPKENGVLISQATMGGFVFCPYGGLADLAYPTSTTRRGRVQEDPNVAPTICAELTVYRIERKTEMH